MTAAAVILPFAFGYLMSYLLRTVNAVIAPDLSAELGLSAADLGLLTSLYFFAFAAFQLPLGVLLDRYGPRRVDSCLLMVAGAGAVWFGMAEDLGQLGAARALIGLGSSAALMASFTAFRHFFPPGKLPMVTGLQMAAGGLGALGGTAPIEFALGFTDWRGVFLILAGIAAAASVTIWIMVPKAGIRGEPEPLGQAVKGTISVFKSRLFWRLAPVTVLAQATFLGVQSLWIGPYLRDVGGLERGDAAAVLTAVAAAMTMGFLSTGFVSNAFGRVGVSAMGVAHLGVGAFAAVLIVISLGLLSDFPYAWVVFGFLGAFGILPYAVASAAFPAEMTGRVVTSFNVLVFLGAFIAQWGIGVVIEFYSPGLGTGFAPEGYRTAFTGLGILEILGIVWYFLLRPPKERA